jgi:acyl phosphate:glycerol-3-phosphate acyltransferase
MTPWAAGLLGYLLGAIPSAELAARLRGRHIFDVGSGNMGAMNTARNLGFGLGVAVFVADVAKGAAATALGLAWANALGLGATATLTVALAAGLGAVVGHAWSVYVGGRGGKALATILGVSLPLYPLGGLAGALAVIVLAVVTRNATLAAVATLVAYPWLVAWIARESGGSSETATALFVGTVPLVIVSLIRHALGARAARRAGAAARGEATAGDRTAADDPTDGAA